MTWMPGREDRDEFWGGPFDSPGATIEWRLLRGKPFAIIYRLNSSGEFQPASSHLIVETVGSDTPGCRIAAIDARSRDANRRAREAADRAARGTASCLPAAN